MRKAMVLTGLVLGGLMIPAGSASAAIDCSIPLDGFSRPDSSNLGTGWTNQGPGLGVKSGVATAVTTDPGPFVATFRARTAEQACADVKAGPAFTSAALIVGQRDSNNLYVKVEDSNGNGDFDRVSFRRGRDEAPFATGGAGSNVPLVPFATGRIAVSLINQNATFEVDRTGDGVADESVTASGDVTGFGSAIGIGVNGTAEIDNFATGTLTPVTPGLDGEASDVVLTQPINDSAVLSGGRAPAGNLTFRVYGPGDLTCTGSPLDVSRVAVNGAGTYTSKGYVPDAVGDYRWTISYSGDANANLAVEKDCSDPAQTSTVRPVPACRAVKVAINPASNRSIRGARNRGVRFELRSPKAAVLRIEASLRYRAGGKIRTVALPARSEGINRVRNLSIALTPILRKRLDLGARVRLRLRIEAKLESQPICAGPAVSRGSLRTEIVRVFGGKARP